ncbi:A/G-specific adenine glycosylase [Paenibacillus sp. GYB004]|uniref:A/G-specific adenine glycosylase n=1 Tax=Paenibacillus sp. GYB004 TaxID=2994393 RepID=UPI002F965AD0
MDTTEAKLYFSKHLLEWYNVHKRDLPWRRSRNPYYIWISEVMLQQTRVETVIPYFHRFVEKFPSVEALADAPEEEVLKAWEGLGYYSRARNLQAAVREVKEVYGGRVPDTQEEISSLKGVGPYTAGAVLSIAYNKPEPAVDGNVMRVLSRYFLLRDDIAKPATRIGMERLAKELIPEGEARDFNQALMELGATVCTPKSPHCLTCPVMEHCAGRMEGAVDELPVKTKAKPPRPEKRAVAFIEGAGENAGKVLARQRPKEGLLARMWELPHVLLPETIAALGTESDEAAMHCLSESLASEYGLEVEPLAPMMDAEHTFSHIHWQMRVYRCRFAGLAGRAAENGSAAGDSDDGNVFLWFGERELEQYALPNVFLKILKQAGSYRS